MSFRQGTIQETPPLFDGGVLYLEIGCRTISNPFGYIFLSLTKDSRPIRGKRAKGSIPLIQGIMVPEATVSDPVAGVGVGSSGVDISGGGKVVEAGAVSVGTC